MFIIKEVHSITDITEEHKEIATKDNPILRIDATLEFRGEDARQILLFHQSDWEETKERGWFGIQEKEIKYDRKYNKT